MVLITFSMTYQMRKHTILLLYFPGRDERLTEQVFSWNRRKVLHMVDSLCDRYSRVFSMVKIIDFI